MTPLITRSKKCRGTIAGQHARFLRGHANKSLAIRAKISTGLRANPEVMQRPLKQEIKGYRRPGGRGMPRKYAHRLRAEQALGKPLPKGAVVHHADGSKNEFAQLVICQDQEYHMLLHRLMTERDLRRCNA